MNGIHARLAVAAALLMATLPFAQGAVQEVDAGDSTVGVAATSGTLTYSAPFDYGMYDWDGGAIHQVGVNRQTGFMEYGMHVKTLYDDWTPWAYTAIGSQHNVNKDWMLPSSYSTPVTVDFDYAGVINCEGGWFAADAETRVIIQQQRWSNGAWRDVSARVVETMGCNTIRNVPQDLVKSAAFSFEAGNIYRLLAKVDYSASVAIGGTVDILFCDGTWLCDSWGGKGWTLNAIRLPNQVPVSRFYDVSTSYVSNLIFGVNVGGRGCDIDGRSTSIVLTVGSSTFRRDDGGSACISHSQTTRFLWWGTYDAAAKTRDSTGAWGTDHGSVSISLFGSSTTARVDPGLVGGTIVVESVYGADGVEKATRVTSDGRVLLDTWDAARAEPGDRASHIVMDRDLGHVDVSLDGALVWSGDVVSAGPEWWNVVPACGSEDAAACTVTPAKDIPRLRLVP